MPIDQPGSFPSEISVNEFHKIGELIDVIGGQKQVIMLCGAPSYVELTAKGP